MRFAGFCNSVPSVLCEKGPPELMVHSYWGKAGNFMRTKLEIIRHGEAVFSDRSEKKSEKPAIFLHRERSHSSL